VARLWPVVPAAEDDPSGASLRVLMGIWAAGAVLGLTLAGIVGVRTYGAGNVAGVRLCLATTIAHCLTTELAASASAEIDSSLVACGCAHLGHL
jgi:hypothetical protein